MPITLDQMASVIHFLDEQNIEVSIFRHIADPRLDLAEEWVAVLSTRRLGKGPSFSITHRHRSFETALSAAIDDLQIYLNVWPKRIGEVSPEEIESLVSDLIETEINGGTSNVSPSK
jgi:hypothetical protein